MNDQISKEDIYKQLLSTLKEGDEAGNVEGAYINLPSHAFIHFENLAINLFINVGQRVFKVHDHQNEDLTYVMTLINKGLKELLILRNDSKKFSKFLVESLRKETFHSSVNFDEDTKKSSRVYLTLKELVSVFGLNQNLIDICFNSIKKLEIQVKSATNNECYRYIQHLLLNEEYNHVYKYIQLSTYFSYLMVDELNILNKMEAKNKLLFASYFSDICVPPHLIFVRDSKDFALLSKEEKKIVEEHSLRASLIISQNSGIPSGVDDIIYNHHLIAKEAAQENSSAEFTIKLDRILFIANESAWAILHHKAGSPKELIKLFESRAYLGLPEYYFRALERALAD